MLPFPMDLHLIAVAACRAIVNCTLEFPILPVSEPHFKPSSINTALQFMFTDES